MPPSLQTGPNQGYLEKKAAEHARQKNIIGALGSRAPITTANNQRRINAAAALAQPFPTRPTRSTSTSSLSLSTTPLVFFDPSLFPPSLSLFYFFF